MLKDPLVGIVGAIMPDPGRVAQVLLLGVFHFERSTDFVGVEVDILAPRRQHEVAELVERLAGFEPTIIAVEALPEEQEALDRRYEEFRSGDRQPGRNEIEQLGSRLAHRLGHERLYAVDYEADFPIQAVLAYARRHDPSFVHEFWEELRAREREDQERIERSSISEELVHLNSASQLARDHRLYVATARVGAGHGNVGADLLTAWYGRNIGIFANLLALCRPGERMLMLIGAGHAPILRQLLEYAPGVRLVEPSRYLSETIRGNR